MLSMISVALGGAMGALMRYGLSLYVASSALPAFVATLGVNIAGCALMGICAAWLQAAPAAASYRPFIMVGFLGALTTFSSFAYDSATLLEAQKYLVLAGYLAASFVLSLGAFFLCYQLARGMMS